MDEADNSTSQADVLTTQEEKYGGIYLGEDPPIAMTAIEQSDPFEYKVYVYGEGKKGKKSKQNDESRFFQMVAAMNEQQESNIKTTFFDVDSWGNMYEKGDEGLLPGLDRLNHNIAAQPMISMDAGGIYLGDDGGVSGSANDSFSYEQKYESFEDFAPFLSGKNRDQFITPPPYPEPSLSAKTKPLYDNSGIYLGKSFIIILLLLFL